MSRKTRKAKTIAFRQWIRIIFIPGGVDWCSAAASTQAPVRSANALETVQYSALAELSALVSVLIPALVLAAYRCFVSGCKINPKYPENHIDRAQNLISQKKKREKRGTFTKTKANLTVSFIH